MTNYVGYLRITKDIKDKVPNGLVAEYLRCICGVKVESSEILEVYDESTSWNVIWWWSDVLQARLWTTQQLLSDAKKYHIETKEFFYPLERINIGDVTC